MWNGEQTFHKPLYSDPDRSSTFQKISCPAAGIYSFDFPGVEILRSGRSAGARREQTTPLPLKTIFLSVNGREYRAPGADAYKNLTNISSGSWSSHSDGRPTLLVQTGRSFLRKGRDDRRNASDSRLCKVEVLLSTARERALFGSRPGADFGRFVAPVRAGVFLYINDRSETVHIAHTPPVPRRSLP